MKKFLFPLWSLVAMIGFALPACDDDEPQPDDNPVVQPDVPEPDAPSSTEWAAVSAQPDDWDGVVRAGVTYQLLVYSFADSDGDGMGDFRGIVAHLDYLKNLGVEALWLSPIHPAVSYHGYDVIDYTAVNPDYGTMADFENLLDEAHARGIKIYLDFVMNHTSVRHPWFVAAKASPDAPERNFYSFSSSPENDIANGKIDMISSEGSNGYNASEWFAADESEPMSGTYKFVLDWSDAQKPTVTVSKADAPDDDNADVSVSKFLYFGNDVCKRFYDKGNGIYELSVDLSTTWGFLVRTSNSSWDGGSKYGAPSSSKKLALDVPFALDNSAAANILFDSMETFYYHSHFNTGSFADINYGPVDQCGQNPAFVAITSAAKGWVDKGVDGFRLDAVKHIYHNAKSDENPRFLKAFYDEVNAHYRTTHSDDIYVVGEVLDGASVAAPYYAGLPALFEFDFWWHLSDAINKNCGYNFYQDVQSFRARYANVRPDFIAATKLSNHDENRTASTLGRSAAKERLAAAVLLTSVGSPYIYYGEELGIFGAQNKGDEFVRSPMLWGDGSDAKPFGAIDANVAKSIKCVAEQLADSASLLSEYRRLLLLRNTYPALASGKSAPHPSFNSSHADFKEIAAWYRQADGQKLLVIHNFGASPKDLSLSDDVQKVAGAFGSVLSRTVDGALRVRLGAYSSVVLVVNL